MMKHLQKTDPSGTPAPRRRDAGDGILIIDKPAGWTSHDVVARVRKILKIRRVGHTGTLDPFATGVLVICLNRATRLVQMLTGQDKEYLATMRLGFATDTGDLTGKPVGPTTDARQITKEMVAEALTGFLGQIKQIPPMYSAKKIGGVKLYELARQGLQVERQPIEVEIKELSLSLLPALEPEAQAGTTTGDFSFRVVCSTGTYVRQLAEDIGRSLGLGAHLIQLRRTRAGICTIDRAISLEKLAELVVADRLEEALIPMADAIALDELYLTADECREIGHGRGINRPGQWLKGTKAKLCDEQGRLIAIAEFVSESGLWQPRLVLIER